MRVYVVQKKPDVLNFSSNTKIIVQELKKAFKLNADVLVTSELFLTGYPVEDRILFSDFQKVVTKEVKAILKESKKYPQITLLIGAPLFENNNILNGVLVIKNGSFESEISKSHLPNYGVFDEKRYFTPKQDIKLITIKNKQVLISICEDVWNEDYIKNARNLKPDLIIILNASPFEKNKWGQRIKIVKQFKTKAIYVNQILGYDELIFDGGSFALNEKGECTMLMPFFQEACLMFNPFNSSPIITYKPNKWQLIYDALVFGLKQYLTQNNIKGVLVGLSGGIDSALVSKIALDAMGAKNVEALMLPSEVSSVQSHTDAIDFITLNGIQYSQIAIKQIHKTLQQTLNLKKDLSKQNLQSRIRGLILMALSNETGKMLLTTGNKSELATGYCTIYGDMNGGFNPIKDLLKTEVYELCKFLNLTKNIFPQNMISKPATAELKENQTDETSLGITYKMLDFILVKIIEEKLSAPEIAKQISTSLFNELLAFRQSNNLPEITKLECVKYVFSLISKSEFKRMQSVIGTKISACAFGRDWRFGLYF